MNSRKILCFIPSDGHGGCEYNALTALKYFRDKHGFDVIVSFPSNENTSMLRDLCRLNGLAFEPLGVDLLASDTPETVQQQRSAACRILGTVLPWAVFVAMPWPKRGQGIILACHDLGVPTTVKFALVPEEISEDDFVHSGIAAAQARQVWFANSRYSAGLIERHWRLRDRSVDSFHVGAIGLDNLLTPDIEGRTGNADSIAGLRAEFAWPDGARIVTTVARMSPQKGYDCLMQAVPAILDRAPDLRFLWIGHGELHGSIGQWIAEAGLQDRVALAGFRTDVRSMLRQSNFFVLPTRYEGGCSQALLEAMEEALPIIVTNVSAVGEVAHHEHNALLVPADDPEALAAAVLRAANDDQLAARLAQAAAEDVKRFSPALSFENILLRLRRSASATGLVPLKEARARDTARPPISIVGEALYFVDEAACHDPRDVPHLGWYGQEREPDGRIFRWTNGNGTLRLRHRIDVPTVVEVSGPGAMPDALESLYLSVDDVPAESVMTACVDEKHGWCRAWRIPASDSTRFFPTLGVGSKTCRPADLDPSTVDRRNLGVAVTEFRLIKE